MSIYESYAELINKYANKGIIPDANVLLIYFIGSINEKLIGSIKGTKEYTQKDYDIICNLFNLFKKIVTTPNILTEVYNLSQSSYKRNRDIYATKFSKMVDYYEELYVSSKEVIKNCYFIDIGLTDVGINLISNQKYLVLTADFKLFGNLQKQKIDAINYNHLKQIALFS